MNREQLIAAARKGAARDAEARASETFRRVIGAFGRAKLLRNNMGIPPGKQPVTLDEVLWAGEIEPRLLELLPAVLVKKPAFIEVGKVPADLAHVVAQMRRGEVPDPFRGMPGEKLMEWLPRVGHKNKLPSRLKSFRFRPDDVTLLKELSEREEASETEVVRRALRAMKRSGK